VKSRFAGPLLALTVAAHPARADFRMCNLTSDRVSVSLAYTDGKEWVSEGWWNLKPADCDTLVERAARGEFYYVYAMDERGGEWKGKAYMCTNDREFKIEGREDCFARGYERTGFFESTPARTRRTGPCSLRIRSRAETRS
jgi:uncharacterized membrane protein